MILFHHFLPIIPHTKQRPRHTKTGVTYTPYQTREHEQALRLLMRSHYRGRPFEGLVRLVLQVYVPKPRRKAKDGSHQFVKGDVDNYVKTVMDSGNGILWKDDVQVSDIKAEKYFCGKVHTQPG